MFTLRSARRLVAIVSLGMVPVVVTDARAGLGQDQAAEVTLAALTSLRPLLGEGAVALDASALCTAILAQWSCPQPVRGTLRRLRMVPSNPDFTHVCPSGPSSCRLVGVRHLVLPGAPTIRGERARIGIDVISASEGAGPTARRRHEVDLARQGRQWRVVGTSGGQ